MAGTHPTAAHAILRQNVFDTSDMASDVIADTPYLTGRDRMPLPRFTSSLERRLWVISQLKLAGSSLSELARQHELHRSLLDVAFDRPADAAEKIIAEAMGTTQRELFPERFNPAGQRLFRVRRRSLESAAA
jgi:lambda repressor-like predicted transcriptional regulator